MKRSITIAIGITLALGIIIIGSIQIIKANTLASALPAQSRVALLNENRLALQQSSDLGELDQLDQLGQHRLPATLNANTLNSPDRLSLLDQNGAHSPRMLGERLNLNLADLS